MATTIFGLFRTAGDEDPLADLKALGLWIGRQPANDYLGFQEAMVRLLEDFAARRPKVTPGRVAAVLELDRLAGPNQQRLLKQYLQPSLSESVRQRLWHTLDDLARWFAYTYDTLFEAVQESILSQKATRLLPGVAARMFHHRCQQSKYGLFRYERWIPGKWKTLHAGFEAAQKRGLARVPFAFDGESDRYVVEQEYLHILLLQRLNTGNFSALQIDLAASWLRVWVTMLSLAEPSAAVDGFWIDLGAGDGLLARRPQSAQGTTLYLDVTPLDTAIVEGLAELGAQRQRAATPVQQAEAAERLALLQRLQQLWRPEIKRTARRGERLHADHAVDVALGLADIADVLRTHDANESIYRRFRHGDPVEVAAGRVQPALGSPDPGVVEFDPHLIAGWRVHDTSESGCRLVSPTRDAAQQRLGNLVSIQEEGSNRWKIGIVRRIKKFSGGQTELGIEIIAQNSLLISPKPLASRNSGYSVDGIDVTVDPKGFDAIYLPPMQSTGRIPRRSMLVPALEFADRRRLFLTIGEATSAIEFTVVLERTKDWVWTAFDIVPAAP